MSYWDISQMAQDFDLQARIRACAAQENDDAADVNMLKVCAAPGWDQQWASAVAADVDRPGKDPGVITDLQILASVQQYTAEHLPAS